MYRVPAIWCKQTFVRSAGATEHPWFRQHHDAAAAWQRASALQIFISLSRRDAIPWPARQDRCKYPFKLPTSPALVWTTNSNSNRGFDSFPIMLSIIQTIFANTRHTTYARRAGRVFASKWMTSHSPANNCSTHRRAPLHASEQRDQGSPRVLSFC